MDQSKKDCIQANGYDNLNLNFFTKYLNSFINQFQKFLIDYKKGPPKISIILLEKKIVYQLLIISLGMCMVPVRHFMRTEYLSIIYHLY